MGALKYKTLFNAVTGEIKQVPASIRNGFRDYEHFFNAPEEVTSQVKSKLMSEVRLDDEVFRIVPQADKELYVSNYGRVKKIYTKNRKEKVYTPYLKKRKNQSPIAIVKVKLNGKFKEVRPSDLVAMCFELKGKGDSILHIDKNPWNCSLANLKWATKKQLIRIAQRSTMHPVIKCDLKTGEALEFYESIREAGRQNFISAEAIRCAVKGIQKTAGGFKWKYDKEGVDI